MTALLTLIVQLGKLIENMKKRDRLLFGITCLVLFVFALLSGYIKLPAIEKVEAQHGEIIETLQKLTSSDERAIEIQRYQLYLQLEECLRDSKTDLERARCNRRDIQDAITQGLFSKIDQ